MAWEKYLVQKKVLTRVILIVGAILVVLVLSLAAIHSYFRWTGSYYFGEIVALEDHRMVIREGGAVQRTVLIGPGTNVRQGRHALTDGLRIGSAVMVVGPLNERGEIVAELIRVVDERRNGKRPPVPLMQ